MTEPQEGGGEVAMDTSENPTAETTVLNSQGIPTYTAVDVPPPPAAVQSFDGTGPRLMITHIVNENFKSYANVQTLGPFHKSFSSIVGPNGSGKSNVIDSMLFVFGYRANKIRSKKISVLIHKSDQYPDLNSCSVAVHFQKIIDTGSGDDDFDVLPNSKFVVSRTAFKDNSSYYKLNDKKATYKEVAVCLRSNGIDLDHNRFLILQGEVEQIAMMKPKAATEHEDGMLEFLEDIIGSSRYKEPIDILTKRVEELCELRGEKLNRVKVVEKEKDDLEGVKNEAVEFLQMENEIVKKKNDLYQKYIWECQENHDKAASKRDDINKQIAELTATFKELENAKKEKGKAHKKIWNEYESLNKKCEEMREKFSQFEQEDVRVREGLKHGKAKTKKLEKTIEAEKKKLEELNMIPQKSEKDVTELNKRLEKLEKEKKKEEERLKEVMDSLKTETQGLQEEKDAKEQELLAMQKQLNEAKSTYKVAQSELDLYLSTLQSEKTKLEDTQKNLARTEATLKDRINGIKDMEKRLPEVEKALGKAKTDLEQASKKEMEISNQIRAARVKVEESRSSLQSSRGRGKILEALVSLKRSGRLPGVYGRLGDLGAIDEKYDVAISTACGALDHIVVDNMETGQKCIEFLRKNDLGVATFILLDKQNKLRDACNRKINTPENVARLFDLVRVSEDALKPAFYFALRDTLVANDLDQATRIAYGKQRYRVVTLNGQLIETSGTMAGGGHRVSKGRMGSQLIEDIDPKILEKLESQLQQDTAELGRCRDTKGLLEESVEKLNRQAKELRHGLDKFKLEVAALTDQNKNLKQQIIDQKERVKQAAPDEKELKKLEKKVGGYKQEFDKAHAKANEKEDEIHSLHKEIMEIGGSKLKAAESKLNMVQTQIDQIVGHITKAKVAVKTATRNAKKTEDKIESLEKEEEENKETVEKLEKEFKDLEENATVIMQEHKKAQESIKEVEVELKGVQTEMSKIEEEEKTMHKDQIEIKHELEKYETVVKDNHLKIKHWKKEVSKLSLHVLEDQDTATSSTLATLTDEQLADIHTKDTQFAITVLEEKLAQTKPNMAAIAEYRKKEEQYLRRVGELDNITEMRNAQRKQLDDLCKQRLDEFMAGFSVITGKLKEMYQMITLGGDAELELVDSLDPFSEGIAFSVRPPKKSWKNISNLSGGEKTLSSLALVFALHHYKPTPLYVMDEIDAALDFKNVSIIATYIKERTKNAQFIIISLRNNMFDLADRLIGIYKTYNCTKSVPIDPRKISLPLMTKDMNTPSTVGSGDGGPIEGKLFSGAPQSPGAAVGSQVAAS